MVPSHVTSDCRMRTMKKMISNTVFNEVAISGDTNTFNTNNDQQEQNKEYNTHSK